MLASPGNAVAKSYSNMKAVCGEYLSGDLWWRTNAGLAETVQNKAREQWDALLPTNCSAPTTRQCLDLRGALAAMQSTSAQTTVACA
jgi:hypothetical protein